MQFAPGFSNWRREFRQNHGEEPNLNDPSFDYRMAHAAGAAPEPYQHDGGRHHWQSSVQVPPMAQPVSLKAPNHPTAWMETFMQRYGVDPHEAAPEQLLEAYMAGIIPR